ncbi:MAG TPA: HD-GYP domain-containing protein [Gemmatimonadales bacterium]|nr:HD-GYP domain-containing protein [Gemmatimonadales bacterium]
MVRKEDQAPIKVYLWVTLVVLSAVGALAASAGTDVQFPGFWTFGIFALVGLMLDRTGGDLRVGATGSTSFVVHLASGILFGPLWGGLIAGVSTAVGQLLDRRPPIKVLFNTAQRTVAVSGGLLLLTWFGAGTPLLNFSGDALLVGKQLQANLGYFLAYAGFYFGFNTTAVSIAVALSSGRRFVDIWNLNAKGVIGYDLAASFIAVILSWLYVVFEDSVGFGALGFLITLAPILVIRHIYGLYRRLQSSGRELLDLMVKAIEARDPYTSGHSVRVATLAKAIAQESKVSTEEIEQVYTAAILHDVGKIHEEFAPLLRKESKLTPEETALLQTHAAKSAELVGIISSFRGYIQNAVRSHHERWDGGGYPDGLAGEDIPLGARIIMISDTADAMMTDRPYRKRLPIEAVIGELQKYRGTQFDPRLVDLVINSVAIRRVMAELQSGSTAILAPPADGGSKRVVPTPQGILRGRSSWPRIRAF